MVVAFQPDVDQERGVWEETNTCDLTIFFFVTARRPQIDRHLFDGALL